MGLDDTFVALLARTISAEIIKQLPRSTPGVQPALLTVEEAGTYLGRTAFAVQHLIAERVLPVVRVGRRVHLHRADLDRWIEKNKF